MKKRQAIVIGATGATGQELVRGLLEDPDFTSVIIFVRHKPKIQHKKLTIHRIDFSKIEDFKALIKGEVLFSCLGTTLKVAGSKNNQYLVDFTYQYQFAQIAAENKVAHYVLVSSTGANENSIFFYPKIKGKLEEAVKELSFKQLSIFRPPTLIRQQILMRKGEKIAIKIFNDLNRLGILQSQKPLAVSRLAQIMISEVKNNNNRKRSLYTPKELN